MPQLVESTEQVKQIISENEGSSIFEFYATWCKPCSTISSYITDLENEFPQVKFYSMSVENNDMKIFMKEYRVFSVPSYIFFKDGEYEDIVKGAEIDKIRKILEDLTYEPTELASESTPSISDEIILPTNDDDNDVEKSDNLIDNVTQSDEQA